MITTTHSPDLLSTVNEKTFENTSVVCRLEDTDDAIIRPVADLSNARELRKVARTRQASCRTALAFTEGNEDDAEGLNAGGQRLRRRTGRRNPSPRKGLLGENRSTKKAHCSLGKLSQDRNRELRPAGYGLIQKQP